MAKSAIINSTNSTVITDHDKSQFNPILLDRQYISEQSFQFINKEISFVRIVEEASKFWQSDEKRIARWESRVEKYFDQSSYAQFESGHPKSALGVQSTQADINKVVRIIATESVSEFTTELAVFGFIWLSMGIAVICTKGKLLVFDVALTTFICIWFGLKNQMIKDNLEDFLVLKNSRLTEMIYGDHDAISAQITYDIPRDLDVISFLE